ncbi:MAG: hypothetical protein ABIR37_01755 [Candidatus Saccharimonadales bacterium]
MDDKPQQHDSLTAHTPTHTDTPLATGNNAVHIVWQWLTYALWTFTLASLGSLLSGTLAYFIARDSGAVNSYTFIVYIIAVTVCLLPAAYIVDKVYSKYEPHQKHGFAAVVMVLHAVLAFVVGLGAAITAVVTALSMATDISSDNKTRLTVIISAVIITILSVLLFARIVRPARFGFLTRKFRLIVTIITAIGIVAAFAGPYLASINSKTDRLIEQNLPNVSQAVQTYVSNNQKLPSNLKDVSFGDYEKGAKTLVDRNLVSYRKLNKVAPQDVVTSVAPSSKAGVPYVPESNKSFSYELCVTYKYARNANNTRITPALDQYSTYIDTNGHKSGKVCYDQYAYSYGIYPADVKASPTM